MTLPIEMIMATLRWMGVVEAEVRLVQEMYKGTTGRVLVSLKLAEFNVNIWFEARSAHSCLSW